MRSIGRYELYARLAVGGMGTVRFGCTRGEAGFRRVVAIKCMHPQIATNPASVASFIDEGSLTARLRHPNIVSTLDVVAEGGQLIIVMDYVHGEALSHLARAPSPSPEQSEVPIAVPLRIALAITIGALHGLHAAHGAVGDDGKVLGLVHRDVSPHNIIVGADGVPRVADFGVAKASGRLGSTVSGAIKGKLAYTAPEQLCGEELTRQADIFSVGVVLWELLAGARLFLGTNDAHTVTNVLHAQIEPPSKLTPEAEVVDAIVLRALARSPKKRFKDAREMASALESTGLVATVTEVADWVQAQAGKTLAERAAVVAEIERAGRRSPESLERLVAAVVSSSARDADVEAETNDEQLTSMTGGPTIETWMPERRRRWRYFNSRMHRGVAVALAAAITFFTASIFLFLRKPATETTNVLVEDPPPIAEVAAAPLTSGPAASAPAAVPSESAAFEQPGRVESEPPVPAPPRASRLAAPPRSPKHAPQKDCASPYTRDELGRKIYKRECLVE